MTNPLHFFRPADAATRIEDDAEIDRLYRHYRLRLIFAMTGGYALYYTCRLGLAITRGPLIGRGIASPTEIGWIGGAIFYGYAFGKLFNGFIADHLNIRRMFVAGLLLSAVCNVVFGFSASLCPNWWTKEERGRYFGIWSTAHAWGEGTTYLAIAAFVSWWGWRAGFIVPAVVCAVASVLIFRWYQDRPVSCGLPPVAEWKRQRPYLAVEQQDAQDTTVSANPEPPTGLRGRLVYQA